MVDYVDQEIDLYLLDHYHAKADYRDVAYEIYRLHEEQQKLLLENVEQNELKETD